MPQKLLTTICIFLILPCAQMDEPFGPVLRRALVQRRWLDIPSGLMSPAQDVGNTLPNVPLLHIPQGAMPGARMISCMQSACVRSNG
jgi:hypothetical protein